MACSRIISHRVLKLWGVLDACLFAVVLFIEEKLHISIRTTLSLYLKLACSRTISHQILKLWGVLDACLFAAVLFIEEKLHISIWTTLSLF
jgi:hypothetical protein